jgi:hypothetical protein
MATQMSIDSVMLAICEQMIPMIKTDPTITAKDISEAILAALTEAKITFEIPHVSRVATEKQIETRTQFGAQARKNATDWHIVKTIPEELAFWVATAKLVPKKADAKVLSTWNVFSMFGGDKSRVPTAVDGVIARPNKK